MNEVKGYSLFNDIEDRALRNRNRAVVLANMAEQYTKKNTITPRGAHLIFSYFDKIQNEDKGEVQSLFETYMKERGYNVPG